MSTPVWKARRLLPTSKHPHLSYPFCPRTHCCPAGFQAKPSPRDCRVWSSLASTEVNNDNIHINFENGKSNGDPVAVDTPTYTYSHNSQPVDLPSGVRLVQASQHSSSEFPFLLYLPDIDGAGVTSRSQWEAWTDRFDFYALAMGAECGCSFDALSSALSRWMKHHLADVPPERPVYLLGEGFGAVLALQLAWDCRRQVNRLILVNPATSYSDSQLARITSLLDRIPPQLLSGQLPAPPLPLPRLPSLPLPFPPPPPLPLALAPILGTSPQVLLRQLVGSISSQQPAEAVQALNRALQQVEAISSCLTPATFLHRLKMLDEGIRSVSPRLPHIPQRTMVLAGGQDVVLGSEEEAKRLVETMQRAFKKVLPDSGHALLSEPGGELLPLLEEAGFYITRRTFSSPVRRGAPVGVFGSAGPVEVPSLQEVDRYAQSWTARIKEVSSPVFLSTLPDGTRVLGLEGLPSRRADTDSGPVAHMASESGAGNGKGNGSGYPAWSTSNGNGTASSSLSAASSASTSGGERDVDSWGDGPLLFVGNHQLYAFDMSVMVEEVLKERGILMRGLAHPVLFGTGEGEEGGDEEAADGGATNSKGGKPRGSSTGTTTGGSTSSRSSRGGGAGARGEAKQEDGLSLAFMGNMFQSFGAVRVTPTAMFRLLAAGEAVLLYPGGVREGFKRRNEKYELFWPSRSEFVRMAARFNATIIPVSSVGLEDSLQILLDSEELLNNPFLGSRARGLAAAAPRARLGVSEDQGLDETYVPPLIAPAVPQRYYFCFGRPIRTSQAMYRDREACDRVYKEVKTEVEEGISYLLRKREQDPYRDFLQRYVYEQNPPFGPRRKAPTFKP